MNDGIFESIIKVQEKQSESITNMFKSILIILEVQLKMMRSLGIPYEEMEKRISDIKTQIEMMGLEETENEASTVN